MALEPFDVTHFATREDFRAWLEEHHDSREVLWVGYWKKATKRPSVTWEDTVDVALCFGWIDGIRKRIDDDAYAIRFTPRRPDSIWSLRNVERYGVMEKAGLVRPPGAEAWSKRTEEKTGVYLFEQGRKKAVTRKPIDLSDEWLARLREDEALIDAWSERPPGYRKRVAHWVMSAKREETRERRFGQLVEELRA